MLGSGSLKPKTQRTDLKFVPGGEQAGRLHQLAVERDGAAPSGWLDPVGVVALDDRACGGLDAFAADTQRMIDGEPVLDLQMEQFIAQADHDGRRGHQAWPRCGRRDDAAFSRGASACILLRVRLGGRSVCTRPFAGLILVFQREAHLVGADVNDVVVL